MLLKHWIILTIEFVNYSRSAHVCIRSYVNGKWILNGDCGGPERMSEIMKELQLRPKYGKTWTVFQRRLNGDVDFYRGWDDYVKGFGNPAGDFWLGLEELHQGTREGNMEMEINMITKNAGIHWVAKYSNFQIGSSSDNYRLTFSGYSGNATLNYLVFNNGQQFSTKDADHDPWGRNCASDHEGGWWYHACGWSGLNGIFNKTWWQGIWVYDGATLTRLRYSEMKFHRKIKDE